MPNEIPVVFHNGSNHFIIKELAKEFEGQFECLGENIEKYEIVSVPIEKVIKKLIKMTMKICKIKVIDSARFMASSVSNPVDNCVKRIHEIKCKDFFFFFFFFWIQKCQCQFNKS